VQERQNAEIKKVAQAKKTIDGLQWQYNKAAEAAWALKDKPDNDPEKMAAMNAATTAWQALSSAYDHYYEQGQGKKTKGGKAKKSQDGVGAASGGSVGSPTGTGQMDLSWLVSNDPNDKVAGAISMYKKLGPPIAWQLRQYNSPDAVKARELARQQRETAATEAQVGQQEALHKKSLGDVQSQIDQLATKQGKTPEDEAKLKQLEATKKVLTGGTEEVNARRAVIDAAIEDVTKMNGGKPPTPDQMERILEAAGAIKAGPPEGTLVPFFSTDEHQFLGSLDQKTGKFVPPPPELAGKGVTKGNPPAPGVGAGRMTKTPMYGPDKTLLGEWYTSGDGKQTWVPAPGQSATPPAKGYGSAGAPEEVDTLKKAKALRLVANDAKKFVAHPTATNAQSLLFAYVKGNIAGAGRLTQTEIIMAAKAGSYGTRIKNFIETAVTGHPDVAFMKEMADTIETEAKEAEKLAEAGRGTSGSDNKSDDKTPPATDAKSFIKKHSGGN
jgi:hypothetical protein